MGRVAIAVVVLAVAVARGRAAAADTTMHFEGDVTTADGQDYDLVTFAVPDGTAEIEVDHSDPVTTDVLDWGVWSPDGFRGWGGGLTDPATIGVDTSSRGYLPGPITTGTWTVVIGEAKLPTGTAHYIIDVTLRTAPTLTPVPRAPYTPVTLRSGAGWYQGDFHVHDTESGDAKASIPDAIALARSRGLDFIEFSDHNTVSQDGLQAVQQQSLTDLLVMQGEEVTTYHGHGNAVGGTTYVDHRVGLNGVDATSIITAVKAEGALFVVNHPALNLGDVCIGCAWDMPDATPWDQVDAIEIQNGNVSVSEVLFTPTVIDLWDQQLDQGFHIAAVGGSDDHTAGVNETNTGSPIGSPTTLVWADELSEASIMDGLAHGRTEVLIPGPGTPRIDLTAAAPTGTAMIGDTITGVSHVDLTATVHGTVPSDATLGIWHDGVKVDQVAVTGDGFTQTFHYDAAGSPERYRAEMVSGGLRIVVTSHIYVDGTKPVANGCGCQGAGSPGGALVFAVVAPIAWRRRRRCAQPAVPTARASAA